MKIIKCPARLWRIVLLLCLASFLCAALFAYVRSSINYQASIDGVTAAGALSISTSYNSPQSAVQYGAGKSQSAGYSMQAGVVLPVGKSSGVNDWKQIER